MFTLKIHTFLLWEGGLYPNTMIVLVLAPPLKTNSDVQADGNKLRSQYYDGINY